jgi:ankyrin repeat protein
VEYGRVNVARLLLEHDADIYAHDNSGRTPLHVAVNGVQHGHVNVARLLLEHGADVNALDNGRNTPLLGAVKHGLLERECLEVARLLVEHGANIDAEDNEDKTAFQVASERKYHNITKLLSDHGSK